MRYVVLVCIVLWHGFCLAQDSLTVHFLPQFHEKSLYPDSVYVSAGGDSLSIETLKFYISGVEIRYQNGDIFSEKYSYHLLDWEKPQSLSFSLPTTNIGIKAVRFILGIDSTANISGAMGGDLDPTNGMYWTWQNGYINLKIEGKSSRSTARNREFQFHLGGYQAPFATAQTLVFPVNSAENVRFILDVATFIEGIDFARSNHVLSPGEESVRLSRKAAGMINVAQ